MVSRGQVKTMVPRACSTLASHPKVKQSRTTQAFPTSKSRLPLCRLDLATSMGGLIIVISLIYMPTYA